LHFCNVAETQGTARISPKYPIPGIQLITPLS
jgi:hypothetical protein